MEKNRPWETSKQGSTRRIDDLNVRTVGQGLLCGETVEQ